MIWNSTVAAASCLTAFSSLTGPSLALNGLDSQSSTDIRRVSLLDTSDRLPADLARIAGDYPLAAYNLFMDSKLTVSGAFGSSSECQVSIGQLSELRALLKSESLEALATFDTVAQRLATSLKPRRIGADTPIMRTVTRLKDIIDMGGVDQQFHRSLTDALDRMDLREAQRVVHHKLAEVFPEKAGPYRGGALPETELAPINFLISAEESLSPNVNETTRSAAMIALATICEQLYPGTCLGETRSNLVFGDLEAQRRILKNIRQLMEQDNRLIENCESFDRVNLRAP